MIMKDTGTCSFQEIDELRGHVTPEDAFVAFCKQNIDKKPSFKNQGICRPNSLYGYYIFSSPVENDGTKYYPDLVNGEDFAKFLIKHKLGDVWEGPTRPNEVFHPDHSNKLWVWNPNKAAVKAWWDNYQEAAK
jgi:hypothetical protein